MNEHDFLTLEEMACILKVHKSWLYSRTRDTGPGSIPRVKVGKYIRFRLDEVMEWIEENQGKEK